MPVMAQFVGCGFRSKGPRTGATGGDWSLMTEPFSPLSFAKMRVHLPNVSPMFDWAAIGHRRTHRFRDASKSGHISSAPPERHYSSSFDVRLISSEFDSASTSWGLAC
jgi:hypothetical protein